MKNLVGLKGEGFEIIHSAEVELVEYPSIKDGQVIPYTLGMPDKEHAEWWANKQKVNYKGFTLTVVGNPILAETALIEMGYKAFSSTPTTVDIYVERTHGGKREGAGNKPIPNPLPVQSIRCTSEELKQLKDHLKLIRKIKPSK